MTLTEEKIIGASGKAISPDSQRRQERRLREKERRAAENNPAPPDEPPFNQEGVAERVWWSRIVPCGYNWTERLAARVLRKGNDKVRIAVLHRKPNTASSDRADPNVWEVRETWVKPASLTPRDKSEIHTARAAFPGF